MTRLQREFVSIEVMPPLAIDEALANARTIIDQLTHLLRIFSYDANQA